MNLESLPVVKRSQLFRPSLRIRTSLGLEKAKGLLLTSAFYWDLDDATRAWSRRFGERNKGRMPTMVQAGVYSAVAHYIKSVAKAGTDDGVTVAKMMHEIPVNDFMTHNARVRNDGMGAARSLSVSGQDPCESKAPWDYYRLIRPIPRGRCGAARDYGLQGSAVRILENCLRKACHWERWRAFLLYDQN